MISSLYRWPVEDLAGLVGRDLVAHERLVLVDDLAHAGVDAVEVVGRERGAVRQLEVVVEAVLDRRADAERGAGEQVEHRLGQHVGRRVADRVQAPLAVGRDDGDAVAVGQLGAEVALLAVDLGDDRRLGQPRTDALGQAERGGARRHGPRGTVGQGDRDVGHGRRGYRRSADASRTGSATCQPDADACRRRSSAARLPFPSVPSTMVVGWAGMASGFRVAYSSTYSWPRQGPDLVHQLVGELAEHEAVAVAVGVVADLDRPADPDLARAGTGGAALAPGGWMSRVPMMPTGTSGAPVRSASRAGPVWPLRSLPSRLRVPSG